MLPDGGLGLTWHWPASCKDHLLWHDSLLAVATATADLPASFLAWRLSPSCVHVSSYRGNQQKPGIPLAELLKGSEPQSFPHLVSELT